MGIQQNRNGTDFFSSTQQDQRFSLDFKRVGYHALRFWYVILASLVIAFAISWYKNRYAIRIYPVTTSIIIREVEETSGAELLYKNALIEQYRNYVNEPYIIRSYPLIRRVVEDLNFGVAFYREGYFMTTEAYDYIPVKAVLLKSNGSYGSRFIFTVVDEHSYSLKMFSDGGNETASKFNFGDSINFNDHHLLISRIPERPLKNNINVPFLLTILDPSQVVASYVSKLKVNWAEDGAGVINLSVDGPNPKKDIDFLNGLIANYQRYDLNKKNLAADRTIEFINDQLTQISDSLSIVENQRQRFQKSNFVTNMGDESMRIFQKIENFELQKTELLVRNNYYQYLEKYLTEGKNLDQVILPSSVGISDAILLSLVSKLVDIQMAIRLYLDKEKVKNPLVENKIAQLHEIRSDILESVRNLRETDKIKLNYLSKQVKDAEKQIGYLPAAEREWVSIQRNYSLLESLYLFLMQKKSEASISRASNTSDISIVNPPMQGGPISPKPSQNYILALMIGLALPIILFIIIEMMNFKIQSKEDIEKFTQIPFLGGIGHNTKGHNLAVNEYPKSSVAESFRALRSNLNFFTGNQIKKIFMISSSISGEGKTFTTINLASVFAMSGKKTLIIGADMRRPKIFADFELNNDRGLSSYLSNLESFQDVVQKTKIENLDMVSGGPVPPNPSELLLTDRFELFLKEALKVYDYILIDTPPLALVTDAFVISKYADHTVFVIRQNYTPKSFLKSIDEYYQSGKLQHVSVLLNDIYKSGLGYGYGTGYGYNYGYSYTYGYGVKSKRNNGYYEED